MCAAHTPREPHTECHWPLARTVGTRSSCTPPCISGQPSRVAARRESTTAVSTEIRETFPGHKAPGWRPHTHLQLLQASTQSRVPRARAPHIPHKTHDPHTQKVRSKPCRQPQKKSGVSARAQSLWRSSLTQTAHELVVEAPIIKSCAQQRAAHGTRQQTRDARVARASIAPRHARARRAQPRIGQGQGFDGLVMRRQVKIHPRWARRHAAASGAGRRWWGC